MQRSCLECSSVLKGRKDQKFCSDYCRNSYNNRLNEDANSVVRQINRILRKNRRILEELIHRKQVYKKVEEMLELGFNFKYHTRVYQTKKGVTYFYCYDVGYMKMENERCRLVEKFDSIV